MIFVATLAVTVAVAVASSNSTGDLSPDTTAPRPTVADLDETTPLAPVATRISTTVQPSSFEFVSRSLSLAISDTAVMSTSLESDLLSSSTTTAPASSSSVTSSSSTTTSSTTTMPPSGSLPIPAIAGIAAGGGAIFLLCMVVVVTVIICTCYKAKCKRDQRYGRRHTEKMHPEDRWREGKTHSSGDLHALENGSIKDTLGTARVPQDIGYHELTSIPMSDTVDKVPPTKGTTTFLPDSGSNISNVKIPTAPKADLVIMSEALQVRDTQQPQIQKPWQPQEPWQPQQPQQPPKSQEPVESHQALQPKQDFSSTSSDTNVVQTIPVLPVALPGMNGNAAPTATTDAVKYELPKYVNNDILATQPTPPRSSGPVTDTKKKPLPIPRKGNKSPAPSGAKDGYSYVFVEEESTYDVPKSNKLSPSPLPSHHSPSQTAPFTTNVASAHVENTPSSNGMVVLPHTPTTPPVVADSSQYAVPSNLSSPKKKVPPIIGPKPRKKQHPQPVIADDLYDTPQNASHRVAVWGASNGHPPSPNLSDTNSVPQTDSLSFSNTYDCPKVHTMPANGRITDLYDTPKQAYSNTLSHGPSHGDGLYAVPKSPLLKVEPAFVEDEESLDYENAVRPQTKGVATNGLAQYVNYGTQEYDSLMPSQTKGVAINGLAQYGNHGNNVSHYDVPKTMRHLY